MTKHYIGIDGGGTKTKTVVFDPDGQITHESITTGSYYRQEGVGVEGVIALLSKELAPILDNATPEDVLVGFGMPGYGDDMEEDLKAAERIAAAFAPVRICFKNDVAAAWAGALAFRAGVTVVGGTGSMSYGQDRSGKSARAGGWHEFYSDEGSGYWLGRKALELYSRECDGRAARGPLYDIMHEHFGLSDDEKILGRIDREVVPFRRETAAMQLLLLKAARAGEEEALSLYATSVKELAAITNGTVAQLKFAETPIRVSYVGGLFHIEDLILEPWRLEVGQYFDADITPPVLSSSAGMVLFAIDQYEPENLSVMRRALLG